MTTAKKNQDNNQLTDMLSLNLDDIIFTKVVHSKLGEGKDAIRFCRVNIKVKNPDGSVGDLIVMADRFSFGLNENRDRNTDDLQGYSLPLVMWSKDEVTEEEKAWTDKMEAIVKRCKKHLVKVKNDLKLPDLDEAELKKLSPLSFKKDEDGNLMKDQSPIIYPKLIVSKKEGVKILTPFYDNQDNPIDPLTLLNKKFGQAGALVKIESLFIGGVNKKLQLKLYECEYQVTSGGIKRLVRPRPKANNDVDVSGVKDEEDEEDDAEKDKDDDDAGSVKADDEEDEEEEEEEEKPPERIVKKKRVVRRVRKVKAPE